MVRELPKNQFDNNPLPGEHTGRDEFANTKEMQTPAEVETAPDDASDSSERE